MCAAIVEVSINDLGIGVPGVALVQGQGAAITILSSSNEYVDFTVSGQFSVPTGDGIFGELLELGSSNTYTEGWWNNGYGVLSDIWYVHLLQYTEGNSIVEVQFWSDPAVNQFLNSPPSTGADFGSQEESVDGNQQQWGDFQLDMYSGDETPEPTTILIWGLLGLIAAGFCVLRRRKAA